MKLHLGNLSYSTSEHEIEALLIGCGIQPREVRISTDSQTGQSKGFGFATVADDEAEAVIEALNGAELGGRYLRVSPARRDSPTRCPHCGERLAPPLDPPTPRAAQGGA